ncbi:MAG: cytochrome c oxidase subunit I [Candidatus Marinimicrobia bacterium]|jgi:cytochrome c oxidase subunit 1|nr:cytochrome c oxidase subunit I [Candidatus Neomarinimicrobiota bacterium]MBT3632964.1 cytochrome c oxidase subunit I [Candidatus Neomarinimicrobiota bacterium]MBT3682074.1 cytochrome c oxidase subunit I [Candidatus Neomarinimicrobiota bacterium]MBT3758897.1 cytochrome c oxidase subunit I [Candidatus Neomarinimicrobiota bacterium]MBT3895204.1 cytochrome c oxidase subunit I [Candidatus Neomarinimicrobiota bacterium]
MSNFAERNFLNTPAGWKSWLVTLDHKRIGLMYLYAIMTFLAVGGLIALAIRLELLNPGSDFVTADIYNRLFTLHGAIMIFLFIIPSIPAALGNIMLPVMIGAKDVALPRLNLLSWYIFCIGAFIALYSILKGGVDTGWTFYTPYSSSTETAVIAMTFGAFILGFSSIFTGINFIVTIHKLRMPGLTWFKLPLFVWGLYATAIIQVLATPVVAITLALLIMERLWGVGIFDPAMGGDPVLFQHFFWFYSHPVVYVMILPGMGIISEVIAHFSKKRIFGYRAIAFSSLGIAFLGFLVWGHHMFTSGQSEYAAMIFSMITFFVAIPSGIKIFNWLATLYNGKITLETPMLYALIFLFTFGIGGLTGIFLGAIAVDIHLHDTYFIVAHFHYTMMGGTVMAFLGGLHYWWPKIFGRMYNETHGKISAFLIFVGFNMTFIPQFFLGSQGMPRRYYMYADRFHTLNIVSTVGSWILAAGFFLMLYYLVRSIKHGKPAGANPWGIHGLEWTTPSPVPPENFLEEPKLEHGPYDYDKFMPEKTV